MPANNEKSLNLVREFNYEARDRQCGYQLVDETTVLERKRIPIGICDRGSARHVFWVSVYDFKSCQVLSCVRDTYHTEHTSPAVDVKRFSEIEGKQALIDAHRALVELGGNPPPLDKAISGVMKDRFLPPLELSDPDPFKNFG